MGVVVLWEQLAVRAEAVGVGLLVGHDALVLGVAVEVVLHVSDPQCHLFLDRQWLPLIG